MGFLFFLYEYRAPLSGPSGCRSSTKNFKKLKNPNFKSDKTYRNLSNGFSASLNEKSRWGPPRWVACSLDLGEGRGQGGGSPGYLRGQEGKRQEAGLLRGLEAEEKCIYYAFEYSQKQEPKMLFDFHLVSSETSEPIWMTKQKFALWAIKKWAHFQRHCKPFYSG